ncbi:unnamed protein product, partial [Brenthis ino]
MVWMVCFYYGGTQDWNEICGVLALSSCTLTCVTKFLFMKLYSKNIKHIVQQYYKCDAQVILGTRFEKNLRKGLRTVKRRATIIWVTLVVNGFVYIILPFITPGRSFAADNYYVYGLMPILESPNYEIATLMNSLSAYFCVYTMVSVAIYIIIIVGYSEAQIYALGEELLNVWDDSQNFYNEIKHSIRNKIHVMETKDKILNEFIRIRLRDTIKFHIININLVHQLDQELRPTLALEFIIVAFSITFELLAGLENTYVQLPFSFVQIYMGCLAGQCLIDACCSFEKAIYGCKWENFSIQNRRTVLLMLRMSQKTLMLSAGGVSKLNYNSLMIILKSTYSTYTTLQSTVKKLD